jgi:hypothetical protein
MQKSPVTNGKLNRVSFPPKLPRQDFLLLFLIVY